MAVHMQWRPRRNFPGNRPNRLTTAPSADEQPTFGLDVIGTTQHHSTAPRGHASSQIGALCSTRRQQQQRSLLSSASVPTVVRYEMLARPIALQSRDQNCNSVSSTSTHTMGRASRTAYSTEFHPERVTFQHFKDDVDYHRYNIEDYCADSSVPLPSEAKENKNLRKYERIKPLQILENRPVSSEVFEQPRGRSSMKLRQDLPTSQKKHHPDASPCQLDVNSNRIDDRVRHTSPESQHLEAEEVGRHPTAQDADVQTSGFDIPHRQQIEICCDGQQKFYREDYSDDPRYHRGGIFRQGKPPADWWNDSVRGGRKSKGRSLSAGTTSLLESLSLRMTRTIPIPSKTQAGNFTAEANRRRASVQSAWSELQIVGHSVGFDGKMSPSFGLRVPPSSGCASRRSVAADKLLERPPSNVDNDAFGTTLYVDVDNYEVESKKDDLDEDRITPSLDLNLHQQDTGDVQHTSARTPRDGIANLTSPSCNGRSQHATESATSPTYRTGWQPSSARQPRTPTAAAATPSSARYAESPGRQSNSDSLSSSRSRPTSKGGLPFSELPSLTVLKISNGNVTRVSNSDTISPTENDRVFSPRSPIEVFAGSGPLSPSNPRVVNGRAPKAVGSKIMTPDTNESATKPHQSNGLSGLSEKPNGLVSSPSEEKFVNRMTICLSSGSETPVTRAVYAQSRKSPRSSVNAGSVGTNTSSDQQSNGMKPLNGEIVSETSTTSHVKLEVDMRPSFRAESDDDLRSNGSVDRCNGVAENSGSETADFVDHAANLPAIIEVPVENGDGAAISNTLEASEIKDGRYFLQIIQTEEDKINVLCATAEKDLSGTIPDEAAGKVRAAVGKGHLLTTKKFRQFRELCDKNLTQDESEQFKTTTQDLAGFWDLVTIQVEDVHNMFTELDALRSNGWKEVKLPEASTVPTSPIARSPGHHSTHTPSSAIKHQQSGGTAKSTSKSPGKSDAAKARDEARKRLMLAKAAGRQRRASETESDEVQIFTV